MNTQNESASKASSGGGSPMAMGMDMAKKMMSQMGQGGSPMEMMQKMMEQMHQQGEGKPPMEKMMGMCMGMLSAIKKTNALAVWATPELQKAFAEWLEVTESEAMKLVTNGNTDTASLAAALKLSEESARYILTRLADKGEITLAAKAKS